MIGGVQLVQVLGNMVGGNGADSTQHADSQLYADAGHPRIYPLMASETDDTTPPYIIYTPISELPDSETVYTGHEWVVMQIDIYHSDLYAATLFANRVAEAIASNIKHSQYYGKNPKPSGKPNLSRISVECGFFQTAPTE